MPAHRVGKVAFEQVVIFGRYGLKCHGKRCPLSIVGIGESLYLSFWENHCFERPYCPIWYHYEPFGILIHYLKISDNSSLLFLGNAATKLVTMLETLLLNTSNKVILPFPFSVAPC